MKKIGNKGKKNNFLYIGFLIVIAIFIILSIYIRNQKNQYNTSNREDSMKETEAKETEEAKETVKNTEEIKNDKYIDLNLTYIGSAKLMDNGYMDADMSENPIKEDGKDDIYMSYFFVDDEENYQYYKNDYHYGIYDEDFEIKFNDKKRYIFSYGRKLKWLEYSPEMVSQFGGFANRAGADWSMEREEGTIYLYEIDFNGPGHLADMSLDF